MQTTISEDKIRVCVFFDQIHHKKKKTTNKHKLKSVVCSCLLLHRTRYSRSNVQFNIPEYFPTPQTSDKHYKQQNVICILFSLPQAIQSTNPKKIFFIRLLLRRTTTLLRLLTGKISYQIKS